MNDQENSAINEADERDQLVATGKQGQGRQKGDTRDNSLTDRLNGVHQLGRTQHMADELGVDGVGTLDKMVGNMRRVDSLVDEHTGTLMNLNPEGSATAANKDSN